MNWDEVKRRFADLAARIAGKPDLRWGVITAVSPLTVRLDGDADPLPGPVPTLEASLLAGERVVVAIQNRRPLILGRGGENVHRTGRLSVATGTLTQVGTTGIYTATITFTVPAVAPPGCLIRVEAAAVGNGWGWYSQVSQVPGVSTTSCSGRFMQVGNSQAQSPSLIWEIVPVGT